MQQGTSSVNKHFIAFSVLVFLIFLFYRLVFVFYPHPSAAGIDNNVVYFIQRVLDGSPLYSNPARPPYAIAQYGPLYYYLAAAVCRVSGIAPDNVLGVFELSKLLCLVLNFLLAATIYFTGKNIFSFSAKKCWFLALLTFIFIEGNSFGRPDSLEHFFFFLSFYFFLLAIKKQEDQKRNNLEYIFSAVIAVFAVMSKQSSITLPFIAFLWLIQKKLYRKSLFVYMGSFVLSGLAVLIVLQLITGVKELVLNMVLGLDNGIHWGSYWQDIIVNFYSWYGCLWVLGFIFVYALLRKEPRKLFHVLALSLLIQFILTNLFALKFGSTSNYFTHWWTMLFIAMAVYWEKFAGAANRIYINLSAIILFFFLLLKTALIAQPAVEKIRTMQEKRDFYETERSLASEIRQLHDPSRSFTVFCNLFSPDSYLNNFMFRNVIVPQYEIVSLASYPMRVYDYTDLRNKLNDGTVEFVITKSNDQPLRFMDIELSNYRLLQTSGSYKIYQFMKRGE